jgi:hypothetical protein
MKKDLVGKELKREEGYKPAVPVKGAYNAPDVFGNLMNGDGDLEKPVVPDHKKYPRHFFNF